MKYLKSTRLSGLLFLALCLGSESSQAAMVRHSLNVSLCYSDYVQTISQLNMFRDSCASLTMTVRHAVYKDYSVSCYNMGQIIAEMSFDNSDRSCVSSFNSLPTAQFEITQPNPEGLNGSAFVYSFKRKISRLILKTKEVEYDPEVFIGMVTLVQGDYINNLKICEEFVAKNKTLNVQARNHPQLSRKYMWESISYHWERLAPDSITGLNESNFKSDLMSSCVAAAQSRKVW
ncbi:MAG: hypothetical protein IT288_10895 [Bdellovibrionales bacterium]|nr:hypothetical protein [Bdellovibrionales bacterium]